VTTTAQPLPFSFGVTTGGVASATAWRELARSVEASGYDLLLTSDHLHQPLAPLPALVAAADATTTLRVGTYVLCQDLRNPTLLANELATIDLLAGGRLDVGLGAGWLETDYRQTGIAFDPGAVRLRRFAETFTIVRRLLDEPPVTFEGEFFQIEDAQCTPHPGRVPIVVGAARRGLAELAARMADGVSLTPAQGPDGSLSGATAAEIDQRIQWIRAARDGRTDPFLVDLVVWECLITPRAAPVVEALAAAFGVEPDDVRQMPCILVGSVEEVAELLLERRERWGATRVVVRDDALETFASVVERLRGR
jgi:probable F420-dependent oxidoreductase